VNDLPLVTFVVPAYNVEKFVEETVRSALDQTYKNVEVIVVDDGSTDATPEVTARMSALDPRVRLIRQQNLHVATARNRGIEESRGAFVHFLDADEIVLPEKVALSYALFAADPAVGVVYGHGIPVEPDGITPLPYRYVPLPSGDVFCEWVTGTMANGTHGVTSSFMVRRELFDQVGMFAVALKRAQDWDMWLRLAAVTNFAALDRPLVRYRRLPEGLHKNRIETARGRLQVIQRLADQPRWRECLDDTAYTVMLGGRWQTLAERLWQGGRRQEARAAFAEAVRVDPQHAALNRLFSAMTYALPAAAMRWVWSLKRAAGIRR
jgi:glycosyltransferase involved in cell wall biosynthesis